MSTFKLVFAVLFSSIMVNTFASEKGSETLISDPNKRINDYFLKMASANSSLDSLINEFKSLELGIKTSPGYRPLALLDDQDLAPKVGLFSALVDLFNPDFFDCGCAGRMKRSIHNIKNPNAKVRGFIPAEIRNNLKETDSAIFINGSGSSVVAHMIGFRNSSNAKYQYVYLREAPTIINFSPFDHFELKRGEFNHFLYTLDCSGYLSLTVNAGAGMSKGSIKTSASGVSKSQKSLFVAGGVMFTPVWEAYTGGGVFKDAVDKDIIKKQIDILKAIISAIPKDDQADTTQITFDANYKLLVVSNEGTQSFNGIAELGVNGEANYGVANINGSLCGHRSENVGFRPV
jgi:hypothetical protein